MFSIFLNFSLNTLLISIATKKTKKRETNRCFDQHRLNERFPPTHIRKSWNGKKKKRKWRKERKGKERSQAAVQKSRYGVVQRREEGGEGARPASKRSIVQRTGKCSSGCSAHVQSLRPIHLCVQFVYLLAQPPRPPPPPPYPLFSSVVPSQNLWMDSYYSEFG